MKRLLLFTLVSWSVLALSTVGYHLANDSRAVPSDSQTFQAIRRSANSIHEMAALDRVNASAREFAVRVWKRKVGSCVPDLQMRLRAEGDLEDEPFEVLAALLVVELFD